MPKINGHEVGEVGYGLMGFTWVDKPTKPEEFIPVVKTALENGATFLNGGELYSPPDGSYNSCHLLRDYLHKHPKDGEKFIVSIKGGYSTVKFAPDSSEKNLRRSVDDCLKALNDGATVPKTIDIFECARVDPNHDIEETVGILAKLKAENKIGSIGLSAVDADTIRKASAVHPIAVVEVAFSKVNKDILANGVAKTCAELDIPICAYYPFGAGILTGQITSEASLLKGDVRHLFNSFRNENLEATQSTVQKLQNYASQKNMTTAQLLLTWIRTISARPDMPVIIPIPGAKAVQRVQENTDLKPLFSEQEMEELEELTKDAEIHGGLGRERK